MLVCTGNNFKKTIKIRNKVDIMFELTRGEITTLQLLIFWCAITTTLAVLKIKDAVTREYIHSIAVFSTMCFAVGTTMLVADFSFIVLIINLIFFITAAAHWIILRAPSKYFNEKGEMINHFKNPSK